MTEPVMEGYVPESELDGDLMLGKNVFDLSATDLEVMRRQIEACLGHVRVWVHPYQSDPTSGYREGLKKILSAGRDGLPTFIFEPGGQFFDETRREVARLQAERNGENLYFVPTRPMNPEPVVDYHLTKSAWNSGGGEGWNRLVEILIQGGVKHCLVGGLNADRSGISDPDEGTIRSCVNTTANELSRRFAVGLSNIAFPVNRAWVMKNGGEWETEGKTSV